MTTTRAKRVLIGYPACPLSLDPPRMVCGCGHTFDSPTWDAYGCPDCCGDHKARPRWANQTDSGAEQIEPVG